MPDFDHEDKARAAGHGVICGIDEAGRGPWAGPVVAAAAILDRANLPLSLASELDDSKRLKAAARDRLLAELIPHAVIGVGQASAAEIDALNILQATFLAMDRAVQALGRMPDFALVDGNRPPPLPSAPGCRVDCLVGGDGRSLSIAAASIAAKVTRDRQMADLAERFPGYGWEHNAGYGTAAHKAALERQGVTPEHRKSYKPIRNILGDGES
jgi:ribonuclease HII|tara:strand:- start:5667 stop:6305 length:639 start_codon:yes stop_codon:yes gene_type:complete